MNVKTKIPKTVKLKTYILTVLLISIISVGALHYVLSNAYVGDVTEVWVQPPFSEAAYIAGKYNTTYFFAQNQTTGNYDSLTTNDDTVLQYAIDHTSSAGGMVYVKSASYSASVTVKDKVRFVIEKGATGITVSINAGATCWIENYNIGRTRYYSSGVLTWDENYATSTIPTLSWINIWNQTVIWVIENYTSLLWRDGWNSTVQNIVDLYALTWKGAWNVTVRDVIETFDSLTWKGLWNSTVEAIIDAHSITWNDNWNSTVESIIDGYNINWNDNWNSTVQEIIANYVWQDSLDMNQNQIVNMTFWQGTSFPSSPVEGQPFYRTDLDILFVYDGSGWERAHFSPAAVTDTYSHSNSTAEQTMLEINTTSVIWLYNVYFDFRNLTQDATMKVYSKINASYVEMPLMRLTIGTNERYGISMKSAMINTDWKFTLTSSVYENATRTITYRYFKEEY